MTNDIIVYACGKGIYYSQCMLVFCSQALINGHNNPNVFSYFCVEWLVQDVLLNCVSNYSSTFIGPSIIQWTPFSLVCADGTRVHNRQSCQELLTVMAFCHDNMSNVVCVKHIKA